jgi:hypothetical protein
MCVISGAGPYNIDVYDFMYGGDGWLIFNITVTNPAAAGWTGGWAVSLYDNWNNGAPNLTRLIDTGNGGATWVGIKPFPNLFRVYRNL